MKEKHTGLFHTYLKTVALVTSLMILLAIGINRLIDPYALFNGPSIEGINANKQAFGSHLRMSKAAAIRHFRPRAIVLGTSRGESGIDPQHPGWSSKPVYNLSLSGGNIYEAYRYLQHANTLEPVRQIVLMLDFFMFNAINNSEEADFDEKRLAVSFEGKFQSGFSDQITTLHSLDALFDSLHTVRLQHVDYVYRQDGFRFRKPTRRSGGQRAVFLDLEKNYYKKSYENFNFQYGERNNLEIYRQLIQLACSDEIDLRIIIPPSHARLFETTAAKGIWPMFEQWKRQLVEINEEEAQRLNANPFPIWDFSGYNSLTTEPVPSLGDNQTEMRWHWESSHYKKELGDLVLDRIFEYIRPDHSLPDDFGMLLTTESINAHLQQIREDREQWRTTYPEDAAEIDALKGKGGPKN